MIYHLRLLTVLPRGKFAFPLAGVLLLALVSGAHAGHDLYLTWVGIVDNLEGDGGLHGPSGSFHLDVYSNDGRHLAHHHLGKGILDGDELHLDIRLGTLGLDGDYLRVVIWESDPMAAGTFGKFVPLHKIGKALNIGTDWSGALGRKHDIGVDAWINSEGLYSSRDPAADDALSNVRASRAAWVERVWPDSDLRGISRIFFRVEARPSTFDLNDGFLLDEDDAVLADPDDVVPGP